ncbi:hypothetical protein ACQP00_18530 [Dactylosporangium sp. CS-047395]|uniref:hypothetical protein n=1 Tax=Dactylosporangium sp. CS-047395 TaxID=3239936 RepID=UPI003D8BA173
MFFRRRKWVRTTGRVIDSRIRTLYSPHRSGNRGGGSITLHNYIVEFTAPNGERTRLEIEQHLDTIDVAIGSEVPLLVRPDGTEASFDEKDPRINMMAVYEANQRAEEERFRKQLEG